MKQEIWTDCYKRAGYEHLFTEESNAHPAKMDRKLCARILRKLLAEGTLKFGDVVLDPMGGIGTTAIIWCAIHPTNRAVTVELEQHFIEMQKNNKAHAEHKLGRPLNWEMIKGDSRNLSTLLKEKGLVAVTSPPYETMAIGDYKTRRDEFVDYIKKELKEKGYIDWQGRKYTEQEWRTMNHGRLDGRTTRGFNQHNSEGYNCVGLTSPPYIDSLNENKNPTATLHRKERLRTAGHTPEGYMGGQGRNCALKDGMRYSDNPSNIGNLKDKVVAVTSPPYENSKEIHDFDFRVNSAAELSDNIRKGITKGNYCTKEARIKSIMKKKEGSIKDKGNIGNQQTESYLSAMQTVYGELAKVCTILCTVTKDPTKAHKLRLLCADTNTLCATVGFERYNYIKARLFRTVENNQATLTNGVIRKKEYKGRVSFFKRLSLQSGNVAADCEDVQFFRLRSGGGATGSRLLTTIL